MVTHIDGWKRGAGWGCLYIREGAEMYKGEGGCFEFGDIDNYYEGC